MNIAETNVRRLIHSCDKLMMIFKFLWKCIITSSPPLKVYCVPGNIDAVVACSAELKTALVQSCWLLRFFFLFFLLLMDLLFLPLHMGIISHGHPYDSFCFGCYSTSRQLSLGVVPITLGSRYDGKRHLLVLVGIWVTRCSKLEVFSTGTRHL